MKKLSTQAPLIREAEEKNLAIQQENWRVYFGTKLSKFNAKSLAEMSKEKKSELFDDFKKDWERGQKKAEITNEAEVKSDDDFKEYAETVLKKAFGDDYDQKKAEETINGILKKVDGDYGAAVGMLTSGLSESNGSLNENSEIFISDKRFQDLDSLKDDILKNITPAINDFLARQGIKYKSPDGLTRWKKYDAKVGNLLIEVNGDYWHANPKKYNPSDEFVFPGNNKITALHIWELDKYKKEIAIQNGYSFLDIWESEINQSKDEVIKKVKDHIYRKDFSKI